MRVIQCETFRFYPYKMIKFSVNLNKNLSVSQLLFYYSIKKRTYFLFQLMMLGVLQALRQHVQGVLLHGVILLDLIEVPGRLADMSDPSVDVPQSIILFLQRMLGLLELVELQQYGTGFGGSTTGQHARRVENVALQGDALLHDVVVIGYLLGDVHVLADEDVAKYPLHGRPRLLREVDEGQGGLHVLGAHEFLGEIHGTLVHRASGHSVQRYDGDARLEAAVLQELFAGLLRVDHYVVQLSRELDVIYG